MTATTVRTSIDLGLEPAAAFAAVVEELSAALARRGLDFDAAEGGRVTAHEEEIGRVVAWEPGRRLTLAWRATNWEPAVWCTVEVRVEAAEEGAAGTRLTVEHRGLAQLIPDPGELAAWFAGELAAPLLAATAPAALGDWLTDRLARRPAGPAARTTYGDPLFHYPNFRVLLAELALTLDDLLLEVGCGGGALLRDALASGCRAAAIDHSPDMVRLARERNAEAVAAGRLEVLEGEAGVLPFPDATFTCAVMTGVLGFLPDPVAALAEVRRVLRPGGRFVALGSDPEVRGTPAAPEPMASRLRFYDDEALAALGRAAGFDHVEVLRRPLDEHAREVGVPEELLGLFAGPGPGARFLLARKAAA